MQFFENTPHHHWLWMRMYRKGTTFFHGDLSPLQVHHGIALDVYPLIGVADSAFGFRLQRDALNLARALRLVEFWWGRRLSEKQIKALVRQGSLLPGSLRRVLSLGLLRLSLFSPGQETKCCTLDVAPFIPKSNSKYVIEDKNGDPSRTTLETWQIFAFSMLDLAKRMGTDYYILTDNSCSTVRIREGSRTVFCRFTGNVEYGAIPLTSDLSFTIIGERKVT